MKKDLVQIETHSLSPDQLHLVKTQICKGASHDELKLFLYQCNRTGLDPLVRQIYAVFRNQWSSEKQDYERKMSIQTSIDGMRLIAQRTGEYAGQIGPLWCDEDGVWKDVWLKEVPPHAAKVGVRRKGFDETLWAVAKWNSYAQSYKKKNSNEQVLSPMWAKMPDLMLAKCAEFLALRKGFPQELSGLYGTEEMPEETLPETQTREMVTKETNNKALNTYEENKQNVLKEHGEYVIQFTKKYVGKKLKEVPRQELQDLLTWCVDNDAKPLFQAHADAYLFPDPLAQHDAKNSPDHSGTNPTDPMPDFDDYKG